MNATTYRKAEGHPIVIRVFNESPLWDAHPRWFTMPTKALNELYLGAWECEEFPSEAQTDYIRKQYPGNVILVY